MRFFARKLSFYLVALWGAVTIDFCLPRLIPGNPAEVLLVRMSQVGNPPAGEYRALSALLGSDHGQITSQYWHYLTQLAHLNFGLSITDYPVPVTSILAAALPWTIVLVGVATIVAFVVGTALGALIGWRRSRRLDVLIPATTFLAAMPYFWLALLLLYLFGVVLHLLPLNGGYNPTVAVGGTPSFIESAVLHSILPGATIVLAQLGGWLLSMRNMTLSVIGEDYVLAAEAKGLTPNRVLIGYAARNAVLPSFNGFALSLGFVVSGSLIMEIVFSYPGVGFELVQAVQNNDYPLMQGIFLIIALSVLGANLLVDLLNGVLDPRIRRSR